MGSIYYELNESDIILAFSPFGKCVSILSSDCDRDTRTRSRTCWEVATFTLLNNITFCPSNSGSADSHFHLVSPDFHWGCGGADQRHKRKSSLCEGKHVPPFWHGRSSLHACWLDNDLARTTATQTFATNGASLGSHLLLPPRMLRV